MEPAFTQEEWDTCIKVLQALSRNPDLSPDTQTLKGMVTRLYKSWYTTALNNTSTY